MLYKQHIVRVNDCGAALGIKEDMSAATARALTESDATASFVLLQRDLGAEQRALQQLCCWAYSITPTLYIERADTLQLEIAGCLKLFRGLDALLAEISHSINTRGYQVEVGLASTPKAAWLLSFTEEKSGRDLRRPLPDRLAPLPLTLLEDFPSTVDSLGRAGLHSLGDILSLPSSALGRRCGKSFIHFLQQMLGNQLDLQPDYQPPKTYSDEYWFGYDVSVNEELFPAIQLMLQAFCQFLKLFRAYLKMVVY